MRIQLALHHPMAAEDQRQTPWPSIEYAADENEAIGA